MRGNSGAAAVVVWLTLAFVASCGQARDETARARDGEGKGGAAGGAGPSAAGAINPGSGGAAGGATSDTGGRSVTGGTTSGTGGMPGAGGLDSAGCDATDAGENEAISAILAGSTRWSGEVETTVTSEYQPDAGPSPQRVVLRIDTVGEYGTGRITFGSGPPPGRPESLNVPWPPGAPYQGGGPWAFAPYDGFEYSVVSAEVEGNTLRVEFAPNEIYRDWCPLTWSAYHICDCPSEGSYCKARSEPKRVLTLVAGERLLCGTLSPLLPREPESKAIPVKLERMR